MRKTMIGPVFSSVLRGVLLPLGAFSWAAAPLAPAQAQSGESQGKTPEELATEGIDKLMRALDLLIQSIPQYEAPVIDENGDIIIRRKQDRPAPIPPQKPPETDSTST
jgi:hypothetical protein